MYQTMHYINGEKVASATRDHKITNPAAGEVIGSVSLADRSIVNAAVSAAKTAFPAWSALTAIKRKRILNFQCLSIRRLDGNYQFYRIEPHGRSNGSKFITCRIYNQSI